MSDLLERERKEFHSRMSEVGASPSISVSSRKGVAMLAHASFSASEGVYSPTPFLMLNLCTAHIGRMRRAGDGPLLEGVLRPGTFALALPNTSASGYWSKTDMLGIAVNLDALNAVIDNSYTVDSFVPVASKLHNDSFLSSVMTALWRDAETHGLSSAFFEQGIGVIFKHLERVDGKPTRHNVSYALKGRRLKQVLDLIESRLGEDISVSELAMLAGQDSRSFTRSFSAATGYAPYTYFTMRRVKYAKNLLHHESQSIMDIALRVGYSNPSKFSAAFRRIVGLSPNTWRKNVRSGHVESL